jgi:serine-type D-Ala-D-Ala endopeptidase (penicillin-binding protein 7)
VGVILPRQALLELALMSSDNRAAASLARTYPGGNAAFVAAVKEKLVALDMRQTSIEEPTGLSPRNRSTASDLVKMVAAASGYSEIGRLTTGTEDLIDMNGRFVQYRNTNRLVGRDGWDIQLSKTGFTQEAGRCLVMRFQAAGKRVIVVLLNAKESTARMMDAENVQRYLNGQPLAVAMAAPRTYARKGRTGKGGIMLVKSKSSVKASKKRRTV